jgi:hypothetical protein
MRDIRIAAAALFEAHTWALIAERQTQSQQQVSARAADSGV